MLSDIKRGLNMLTKFQKEYIERAKKYYEQLESKGINTSASKVIRADVNLPLIIQNQEKLTMERVKK